MKIIRLIGLFCFGLLLCFGANLQAQSHYKPDILGEPYESRTISLPDDYSGSVEATLVRHKLDRRFTRAVLYIHGYNDYFFQAELGDSIVKHRYNFYALDLRKYGRSLRAGQRAFECLDLKEYQAEISLALEMMRQEGHSDIYLMAHSTGCLISALYLHDTKNKDGIRGLILNSPFIDFNSTSFNERILLPLVTSVAWLVPNMVIIPPSSQDDYDHYSSSLLQGKHGKWNYRTDWKMPQGYPIRTSWLRAIKRGHNRVQAGLDINVPILLMSSDASIRPRAGQWQERYGKADLVLDVKDMWRYGSRLGREVHFAKIPNGIHDLFLSPDDFARSMAYDTLFFWLRMQERRDIANGRPVVERAIEDHSSTSVDSLAGKVDIKFPILYRNTK
ncbi:MAG: alpha/beta hydrolase [Porphyromonadaceae bacterium]|nr:alpha/beta hydrolase [Porphyromonadaceae bacterium]